MGNWRLTSAQDPHTLTEPVMREMRSGQRGGLSRRELMRRSIGIATGLWVLEILAGTIGFLWPNLARGFGGRIEVGDIDAVSASPDVAGLALRDGAPAYLPIARSFVQLEDPTRPFLDGASADGTGRVTNVWTFWQKCPHLGCKPNFCETNFWFECPCHGSRFDRLGVKIKELGPAPRGLDRFPHVVDGGRLTIDTSRVILGPLPIALGQPGLIPARSPAGCL